jgi:hypothetical protein
MLVKPLRILLLDEPDFPFPPPLLQFLLARDGRDGILVDLEPQQTVALASIAVSRAEGEIFILRSSSDCILSRMSLYLNKERCM